MRTLLISAVLLASSHAMSQDLRATIDQEILRMQQRDEAIEVHAQLYAVAKQLCDANIKPIGVTCAQVYAEFAR